MENFSYHVPFYVVTGGVDLAGHSSELTPGQVGLFDRATFSVATASGNGKELFFAQGNNGGKDWYGQPVSESHKSPFFFAEDVENMYVSMPQTIQNEEWVLGFNGAASSNGLTFEEGKAVRVKFYFHGQPTYRFFGGPKEYVVSYTPPKDCTTPCNGSDCPDPIVDCLVHTQALIDEINNHVELKKFGVQAKLVNAPYVAATPNATKWQLELCDNGDVIALQAVQAQAPTGVKVQRVGRSGSTSTYEFCQASTADDPADFSQSGSVELAICKECPDGSVLAPGGDVYSIVRPLAGTENLTTANLRQTYADSIGTAYFPAETFDGATAVDPATDRITVTAHGWVANMPVVYDNGGGTSITGLTDGETYYVKTVVDANTITLSADPGGTVIDITADGVGASHTLTPVVSPVFIGQNGATAQVQITVPTSQSVSALLADTVEFIRTQADVCNFTDPSDVAWTEAGDGIYSTRKMKIKALQRTDCSAGDRLADLESILAGVQGIKLNTLTKIAGTACADDYTVEQDSIDCLDEACLTNNVTFTYDDLPSFEGKSWELVPAEVVENENRKCGIRITAGYVDPKTGNCNFDITSYFEVEPVKFEVSLLVEDGSACDYKTLPSQQQTKIGRVSRQTGEWVIREVIMKDAAYLRHIAQYSDNPLMREKFDINVVERIDRNAFYKLYYITFNASYGKSWRKNEQEKFTAVFAFKEDSKEAEVFEKNVINVLAAKSKAKFHVLN